MYVKSGFHRWSARMFHKVNMCGVDVHKINNTESTHWHVVIVSTLKSPRTWLFETCAAKVARSVERSKNLLTGLL